MEIITTITGQEFTEDMYERLRQGVEWDTEPVDGSSRPTRPATGTVADSGLLESDT